MDFPDKKYKIIYADPPWPYVFGDNSKGKNKKIWDKKANSFTISKFKVTPYSSMPIDKILSLPVNEISDDNSVLLLWVTFPALKDGLRTMESWGFKYITNGFTWVKKNRGGNGWYFGLGNYTRANSEICILGKKGKGCKVLKHDIRQVIDSPLTTHSKKPDIVRTRIIELFGDLPRIELFARTKIHGWDVWGNDEKLKLEPLEHYDL